ncbi:DNA-binding response regulator, OmpR family, contains REC and winged-helix (wHTH) domain [Paenibacillus catalpae]|uniref:DNA-binding response regulator, OmpR family, contains REC and winged-helix (WHTH) domain n=1 Tax=Paenibacillus catalpae TaxID=1045775 RepID=A0A1I1YTI4_9BACL|nr:response regulator transcription factor [Paenibacillus catalpae]SFE22298.1 DNA-binding response regulator, OmpR family, contains REC and winged-helix (wHTH) domain [Paenibacillus catalpae]
MTRILIVEDDPYIAELQKDYFALHGYEAEICHDGHAGLSRALSGDFDLIILDIQLPGMNGFEICKTIRERLDVPILIVSAKNEELDKIRGFGFGADDFVTKPFSPNELVARTKAHLARYERYKNGQKSDPDESLHIRELTINPSSHRVFVHEQEVFLTAKEFEVLVFMATHPNRVFSKDQLFEKIWGYDSNGDIATVTVHISRIREKLEADPSNPQFIETVWGAGYRFTV